MVTVEQFTSLCPMIGEKTVGVVSSFGRLFLLFIVHAQIQQYIILQSIKTNE